MLSHVRQRLTDDVVRTDPLGQPPFRTHLEVDRGSAIGKRASSRPGGDRLGQDGGMDPPREASQRL
jgi:hypothetical protein